MGCWCFPFAGLDRLPVRVAILGNAAGTVERAYGHFFPASGRRGRDRRRAGRSSATLLRPASTTAFGPLRPTPARGCATPTGLRRDRRRRLPPALHPLLSRHAGVLPAGRDRLAPGGVVVVNVGHPEGNDDLEQVVGRTMADVFRTVLRDPIKDSNTLLLGTEAPRLGTAARDRRSLLPELLTMPRSRRAARAAAAGRRGLHGRSRSGRVADRPLDPGLRRRRVIPEAAPEPARRPDASGRLARGRDRSRRRPVAPVRRCRADAESVASAELRSPGPVGV